jgi:hypothetical protein
MWSGDTVDDRPIDDRPDPPLGRLPAGVKDLKTVNNVRGNTKSTRTSIPDEEKEVLKKRIFELHLEGVNFTDIGKELGIHHLTAQRYFEKLISEMSLEQDLDFLWKRERARTERMYTKAIFRYYEGIYTPSEVREAAKMANKWNGLEAYSERVDPNPATSLLKVEVVQIPIEMPPTKKLPHKEPSD